MIRISSAVMTDEDLMLRYRQGSADALEELFGRYREMAVAPDEPVEFQNQAVISSVKKLILDVS